MKEYRMLEQGELIEEGDEWVSTSDISWSNPRKVSVSIGCRYDEFKHSPTRRPITSDDTTYAGDTTNVLAKLAGLTDATTSDNEFENNGLDDVNDTDVFEMAGACSARSVVRCWVDDQPVKQDKPQECCHDFVSAANEVVSGAEICKKCYVIRAKSEQDDSRQEWDGNGLPPVGVECEWFSYRAKCWTITKVKHYDNEGYAWLEGEGVVDVDRQGQQFRPLKTEPTEAEIAETEVNKMYEILFSSPTHEFTSHSLAKKLYALGFRLKESGNE